MRPESKIILRSTINIETIETIETNELFIEKDLNLHIVLKEEAEGMSLRTTNNAPNNWGKNDEDIVMIYDLIINHYY